MRLVLVDDHPIVLAGLDRLFAETPDVEVVARCQTGREALDATRTMKPDLVLLDLKLPDISGIEVLGRAVIVTLVIVTFAPKPPGHWLLT